MKFSKQSLPHEEQMSSCWRATAFASLFIFLLLMSVCPVTLSVSPLHEQVCDSVLSGEVGAKYSLRLTEPVSSRFHTFRCDITFEPPTINSLRSPSSPSSSAASSLPPSPVRHEYPEEVSSSLSSSARGKLPVNSEASIVPASASSSADELRSSGQQIGRKNAADAINGAKGDSLMIGDVIELTFLSFQVGSFELTKENEVVCSKGHLTISEKLWPPGRPSLANSFAPASTLGEASGSEGGRFCGQMMSRKAVFYSSANSTVTLSVYLPPGNPFFGHSSHFSLFLIYKFLSSKSLSAMSTSNGPANSNGPSDFTLKTSQGIHETSSQGQRKTFGPIHHQNSSPSVSSSTSNSHDDGGDDPVDKVEETLGSKLNPQQAHLHLHPWNSKSNCDVIFDSCVPPKVCTLVSPNFPGFYLRNVTCNYWFRESNVPSGYTGYYTIQSKPTDERLSLAPVAASLSSVSQSLVRPSGSPRQRSNNWSSNESLAFGASVCSSFDSITVYSGHNPSDSSAIVARFCSNGKLPLIITPISSASSTSSQRDGMVIVFKSTSNSLLFDSRFQLTVQSILIPFAAPGARFNLSPAEADSTGASRPVTSPLHPSHVSASSPPSPCDMSVEAEQISAHQEKVTGSPVRRSGVISLPLLDYHMPVTINSTCTLRFISKQPGDRVWLTFSPIRSNSTADSHLHSSDLQESQCSNGNSLRIFGSLTRMQMPVTRHNATLPLECASSGSEDVSPLPPASHSFSGKREDTGHPAHPASLGTSLCEGPSHASATPPSQCSWNSGFLTAGSSVTMKKTFRSTPALFSPFLLSSKAQITSSAQLVAKLLPVNGYTVHYEFVDLKEYGDPVANSVCDRIIKPASSATSLKGVVASTRNTFLFARGSGRRHLSCSYELTNEQLHMIKIHFTSIRLVSHSCTTTVDPATRMYTCSNSLSPPASSSMSLSRHSTSEATASQSTDAQSTATFSSLTVFDSISSDHSLSSSSSEGGISSAIDRIQIGCLCSSPASSRHQSARNQAERAPHMMSKPLDSDVIESSLLRDSVTFEALGPRVLINFTVLNMQPDDDFVRFGFHARYEYIARPRSPAVIESLAPLESVHEDISESGPSSGRVDHSHPQSPGQSESACSSAVSLGKKHASHGHLVIDEAALASHIRQPSGDAGPKYPPWLKNTGKSRGEGKSHLSDDWRRMKCRYLIKSVNDDSHLFLQFPLFAARPESTGDQVDCAPQDAIRVYTAPSMAKVHANDQQVITWVPLRTFCFSGVKGAGEQLTSKEESARQSSIIIKSHEDADAAGPDERAADASKVHVLVELLLHENARERQSSLASENGSVVAATWLEVTKQINCATFCPEVGGCISADLWCDGVAHCPSALDEANCDHSQMHTIITSENEATLLSSSGRDTSNAGVKSSVSNSSALSSTSILTLVLSLTGSLILIVSVIAVAAYVIKSSDLRRRIRRAKAALDLNRKSSASASASSAASYSSSHYSFNFPRLSANRTPLRSADLKTSLTISRQMSRHSGYSMHTSARCNMPHGNLASLEGSSTGHRKDLSPLVISSLNTSIDTTGTNSNNSSCSSSGGTGVHATSHLYHRPSSLFRPTASAVYSPGVTAAASPLIAGALSFSQNAPRQAAEAAESFLPSEKEFDYRSFIVTPSFTSSSRTCSRSSCKGSSGGHAHTSKPKMKNVPRKHRGDDEDASQLELLMQHATGPLVPSSGGVTSCSQASLTFRSSRIMTLSQPAGERTRPTFACRQTSSPAHSSPYVAFNLYEDICDVKATSSSSGEERGSDCLATSALDYQLTSRLPHKSSNDSHKLQETVDDDTSDRDDEGNIISANDATLERPLGVNLHPTKISSHHVARRNVF